MSKSWSEEMVYRYQKEIQLLTKERDKLKKELSISNKALELAVAYMFDELNIKEYKDIHYDGNDLTLLQENINYFKTKAEEHMKNEVNND